MFPAQRGCGTALQTPKGSLQGQPLEGRKDAASHLFTPQCVFQYKVRKSGNFVLTTQTQTPKLWTGVSSRQWVGAEVHAEVASYMPRGIKTQCYQNYMSQKLKENILWLPPVLNPTLRKVAQHKLSDDKMQQGLFLSLFVPLKQHLDAKDWKG